MTMTRRFWLAGALALGLGAPAARAETPVLIFAAASLKNAVDEAAAAWSRETGHGAKASYAASNALAKQIEAGAPADLFISADLAWMDAVEKAGSLRPGSRSNLLRNSLVLVAPADSTRRLDLKPGLDLAAALGGGRLAVGNVEAVPAGKYGKAALQALGAWDGVKDRLAQAENVRAALLLVARGEAPLGIVYATDAASDPSVRVVATFPPDSHPPIVYPVALLKDSQNPEAGAFLAYLKSPAARPFFEHQGFTVLGGAGEKF
ncbi:molybdate ABC transporter substrate-binding protein [Methylobacterium soli]|uniref:Molybdate ABC transporter substrate-binding protein n=1 Tax=Methylobacterium soli TaxID=553447 RepID=A0A6L3SXB1_9HYPH|nr:molybdate ABC transporter substrate-binding protein [Methylobacterium soli]KAB1076816.1 molybdate ABC transporter substrate-binding protein [Methylobacterium soli]GJE43321.1 Molybdate-binding protein ModA [Methylobacterium soli]